MTGFDESESRRQRDPGADRAVRPRSGRRYQTVFAAQTRHLMLRCTRPATEKGRTTSEARRVAIQLQPAYANPASRRRIQCRKMKGGWSMYARFSLVLVTALCWCGFAIAPAFAVVDAPACEPAVLAQAASGSAAQSCAIDAAPTSSGKSGDLNSCADSCRRSYESCKRSSKNSKGKGDSCERSFDSCARSCGSGKGRV